MSLQPQVIIGALLPCSRLAVRRLRYACLRSARAPHPPTQLPEQVKFRLRYGHNALRLPSLGCCEIFFGSDFKNFYATKT